MSTLFKISKAVKMLDWQTIEKDHEPSYYLLSEGDVVVEIQKCDLKYTLFELDQNRKQVSSVLNQIGILTSDKHKEYILAKKILSKEKTIYGYKIFCPKIQKTLWISTIDYNNLVKINDEII